MTVEQIVLALATDPAHVFMTRAELVALAEAVEESTEHTDVDLERAGRAPARVVSNPT